MAVEDGSRPEPDLAVVDPRVNWRLARAVLQALAWVG